MSYTLHWPNTSKIIERGGTRRENVRELSELDYKEKIEALAPGINLQADVLYSNAYASVNTDCNDSDSSPLAIGCKGNQVDEEFPLEAKVPHCLPLVQYPTATEGKELFEQDMCALPVLNWENYIKNLKHTAWTIPKIRRGGDKNKTTHHNDPYEEEEVDYDNIDDESEGVDESKKTDNNLASVNNLIEIDDGESSESENDSSHGTVVGLGVNLNEEQEIDTTQDQESVSRIDSIEDTDKEIETLSINQNTNTEFKMSSQEDSNMEIETLSTNETTNTEIKLSSQVEDSSMEIETLSTNQTTNIEFEVSSASTEISNNETQISVPTPTTNSAEDQVPVTVPTASNNITYDKKALKLTQLRNILFNGLVKTNFNESEIADELDNLEIDKNPQSTATPLPLSERKSFAKQHYIKKRKTYDRAEKLSLISLRKYKNQPHIKIRGTWNFLFNGSGAIDYVNDYENIKNKIIITGCGQKLRVVSIKPSKSSLFSYKVNSIWEEDKENLPRKNLVRDENEPFDDLIFQIKSNPYQPLAAVRRGKSVSIYNIVENPSLISTIPNIGYGQDYKDYLGCPNNNPLLLSMDWNSEYPHELLTYDDNNILRFCDIVSEKTVQQLNGCEAGKKKSYDGIYPEITLNEASGACFTNNSMQVYQWANSEVNLIDRRLMGGINTYSEMFELRYNTSSIANSDQKYFVRKPYGLNEYISCVQQSGNQMYYYIGTTTKILLMDMRVPQHPVLRISHCMRSAATYIESYNNGSFEIVIAGSQRVPEIFCATLDYAHLSCQERIGCNRRNPILTSYPRHLSNSREFYDSASLQGFIHGFPSDDKRTKDHCYAWCTGVSLMNLEKQKSLEKPPSIAVFSSNNFGDIFYQEWHQKPIENKISKEDEKLQEFLGDYIKGIKPDINDFLKESQNPQEPIDCTLLIEPNAKIIESLPNIRHKKFNVYKPDVVYYEKVKKSIIPLQDQVERLRKYKGDIVTRVLDIWSDKVTPIYDEFDDLNSPSQSDENIIDLTKTGENDGDVGAETTAEEMNEMAAIKEEIESEVENNFEDNLKEIELLAQIEDDELDNVDEDENEFGEIVPFQIQNQQQEQHEYEQNIFPIADIYSQPQHQQLATIPSEYDEDENIFSFPFRSLEPSTSTYVEIQTASDVKDTFFDESEEASAFPIFHPSSTSQTSTFNKFTKRPGF